MNEHRCLLIIPAFNERPNIDPLFDGLRAVQQHIETIIVADNGSTDGTACAAQARGAVVVREPRTGYGSACQAALKWIDENPGDCAAATIAFIDADLSDDPAALPGLLQPIMEGRADLVIGSRIRLAEPGALNMVQRFGNRLACALMRLATGQPYSDLGPFRAITRDALRQLDMADRTWGWTVEMQMKAALQRLRVVEVDVPYRRRRHGRSKISGTIRGVITAGSKIILTIAILWWRRRSISPIL